MPTFTKEQIKDISEQLDCGFLAYCHKKTGDLIFIPDPDNYIGMDTEAWQEDLDKVEENFSDYYAIEPMEPRESFRVMAGFAEQLTDIKLQEQLLNALDRKKPFREFKYVIDNAGEQRQKWFDFKNNRYIEWTEKQLKILNELERNRSSGD